MAEKTVNIMVVGTSHKHSPVEIRELVAFADEELPDALNSLSRTIGGEAVIISTCNRTELYIASEQAPDHTAILGWLNTFKSVSFTQEHLFTHSGNEAARHLFDVAAGIDSQVVGDIQITGQVREAYQIAQQTGTTGKMLARMFDWALRTAKRVKNETGVFSGAVSVSYIAVELARKIFHPLSEKHVLIVGAGETGELTARNVRAQGVSSVTIANRTEANTHDLLMRLGFGQSMPLGDMPGRLHEFDIVIVSTAAPDYLITHQTARSAMGRRGGATQLIVDLSVPRNVEPSVADVAGIFCKDLNDLTTAIESNMERRRTDMPKAELIIADELAKFTVWCSMLPVTPVISQLQQRGQEIMRGELEKNRHRFSAEDFLNVEKLVGSVVRKLIGMPMRHLLDTEAQLEHVMQKAEFVSVLFNLEHPPTEDPEPANGTDQQTADKDPAGEPL